MAKNNVRDWDATASNNTDIAGIGIQGTNLPSNFDNALRTVMAQVAAVDAGTEPVNDTWTFCDPVDTTKRVRIDAGTVATATTRVLTMPDADVTISAFAATLLDDAAATNMRVTLGLGTSSIVNTGTSGATIPLLNAANTFSGVTSFTASLRSSEDVSSSVFSGTFPNFATGTTAGYYLANTGVGAFSRDGGAALNLQRSTSDGSIVTFNRGTSSVGSISVTTTATAYNTSSDGRAKTNRKPLSDVGSIIDAIEPQKWEWTHEPEQSGVGFIAQELHAVVPEAVTVGDGNQDLRPGDEGFEWWSVDMSKLVPYLVAEIKILRSRVASLERG